MICCRRSKRGAVTWLLGSWEWKATQRGLSLLDFVITFALIIKGKAGPAQPQINHDKLKSDSDAWPMYDIAIQKILQPSLSRDPS